MKVSTTRTKAGATRAKTRANSAPRSSDFESVGDILARVLDERGELFRWRLEGARRESQGIARLENRRPP